jgi:hypothetical protein
MKIAMHKVFPPYITAVDCPQDPVKKYIIKVKN